ncbi:hydrolase [Gracilibacillus sp. S3-1-1]|uniref:Hydrolase n=1 Tax=Gracilibacillus pellucidus TaxID=3095368 RepID=A0ACC6M1G9_9BACI|nr:hydrolase [Gracilibacillus sp. S3-1-1]MDX8044796.1 hydrolase [Gracilibacillus sp. S3-1-1]
MEKKTYYVNIASQEISQIPYGNNTAYTIEATDEEITQLRAKFNEVHEDDFGTFIRAHIPYVQYHQDTENDEYDTDLQQVIQMLYQLATPETKKAMDESDLDI